MFNNLMYRLRPMFRRNSMEAELDEELRAHVEQQAEKYVQAGLSPEEAARRARLEFGGVEQVKEECRDSWGVRFITELGQDLRYGLRQLRRNPGFTGVAVLTLALGVGANAAIFSIIDAVILRPLPFKNANRLVFIMQRFPKQPVGASFDTYREFQEWKRYSHSFEKLAVAAWGQGGAVLSWHGEKREVGWVPVSVEFFSMLGVQAAQGRTFDGQDLSNSCTVVLSHQFWQERLAGTPYIVGDNLVLNDTPCTVAGIMPKPFSFYPKQTQLWTLITPTSDFSKHPWGKNVAVFGLLKQGVSRGNAKAELTTLQNRIIHQEPELENLKPEPDVQDLQRELTWLTGRNLRRSLIILFGAVLFVLLIACVNVANLFLGRAAERQRELGIRAALGSGRFRLIRQLLTESVLLSAAGTLVGVVAANYCLRYVNAREWTQLPPGNPVSLNWQVLAFAAALAILTGLFFGLFPAWKVWRVDLNEALKETSSTASRGIAGHQGNGALAIAEIALSLVLLAGAGLLLQSMDRLANAPMGFERSNLLFAYFKLPSDSYPKPADWIGFDERVRREVRSIPGVQGVSFSPLFASGGGPVTVEGQGSGPSLNGHTADMQPADTHYFRVMGIPVFQGRTFDELDQEKSAHAAVVNKAFAAEFFKRKNPIGWHFRFGQPGSKTPWLTIVGVVGNVRHYSLFKEMGTAPTGPIAYVPLRQDPARSLALFVRTAAKPQTLKTSISHAFTAVGSNVPAPDVETMNEFLSQFTAQPRLRAVLLGIFAALALFLAAVGIYGIFSRRVSVRKHEIGIRMALGAEKTDVMKMVIGQGLRLALVGVAIGVVGALALTRFLASLLYGVKPTDPLTFIAVSLILIAVALVACYIPARRASKVDPMVALRYE
jgi:putative ABC transport system permease protein